MSAEKTANELILRVGGIPRSRELLHALLCLAYQQGKVDAGLEIRDDLRQRGVLPHLQPRAPS